MTPNPLRPLVVTGLALVSFLLWVSSVCQARPGMGEFGLISVLPLTFFVSLSLLTLCFLSALRICSSRIQIVLFCDVMMLILFLNLSPAIIEGTPRFGSTYRYYQAVDYILQFGKIETAMWFHSWPASSIAFSALVQTTALARTPAERAFLSLYPTLFNIALFFPVFSFIRMILPQQKLRWIAVWIFYIANWVGQDYFNAQSVAFFVFILLLLALFKLMDPETHGNHWFLVSILLFCFLATGHTLSSIAYLAVILVFSAFKHFRRPIMLVLFTIVFASWIAFGATSLLPWLSLQVLSQAFNFEFIFAANLAARVTTGSAAHLAVTRIRVIYSALLGIIALSGLLIAWKRREIAKADRRVLLVFVGLSSLLSLSAYGGELFQRIFLLSLLPLAYSACKGLERKHFFTLVAIFLVIAAPPLHIIAHYGNEIMDYVPVNEIKGVEFFHSRTTKGYVVGGIGNYRDLRYRALYRYYLPYVQWNSTLPLSRVDWPTFVCITYTRHLQASFFWGEPEFVPQITKSIGGSARYDKIYSNPSFEVYLQI